MANDLIICNLGSGANNLLLVKNFMDTSPIPAIDMNPPAIGSELKGGYERQGLPWLNMAGGINVNPLLDGFERQGLPWQGSPFKVYKKLSGVVISKWCGQSYQTICGR